MKRETPLFFYSRFRQESLLIYGSLYKFLHLQQELISMKRTEVQDEEEPLFCPSFDRSF